MKPLVTLMLAALACSATAQGDTVYKYRDSHGGILFTDRGRDQVGSGYVLLSVRKGWQERTRKLTDAMRDQYDPDIRHAAASYDVDPGLIKAVIHAESLFDPFAVSRAGARGLMQLMPETAGHLRVHDPFQPRQNIMGGARFLSYLGKRFERLEHVLAAYNAGEGNVRRYGGIPPFAETRGYVRKVMELLPLYRAQFGAPPPATVAASD